MEAVLEALDRDELFIVAQPMVDLRSHRWVGGEVLLRWRHPLGVISAGQFITVAEGTPLSGALTYRVIDLIARDLLGWLRAYPEASLSLNIPPEVLGRGALEYAGRRNGMEDVRFQIILEITERGFPDGIGVVGLTRLTDIGLRIALDDVATLDGPHLGLLMRGDFSIIKLDRTLVAQITPDRPHPEWITGLAAVLGVTDLHVIGEGIETIHQAEVLRDAGVQWGQGHFFSPPLPVELFTTRFAECC